MAIEPLSTFNQPFAVVIQHAGRCGLFEQWQSLFIVAQTNKESRQYGNLLRVGCECAGVICNRGGLSGFFLVTSLDLNPAKKCVSLKRVAFDE